MEAIPPSEEVGWILDVEEPISGIYKMLATVDNSTKCPSLVMKVLVLTEVS